jgi:hypothetical protein
MRRPLAVRALLALVALGLALGVGGGLTYAAFFDTANNPGNSFSTNPDWTAPTIGASVIQKNSGGAVGVLTQGVTYRVYQNVTDAGSPPAGVASVTADVSTISAGQNNVAVNSGGGPWTVGGVTYTYRSGSLTADNPLGAGTRNYSVTATDSATPANSATQGGFSVVVDNTGPAGANIQTANRAGGTAGQAEQGDTITYTYSEAMDPGSFLAAWDGTATNVTLRLNQNAGSDQVQIWNAANAAQLPFGTVSLGANHINGQNRIFSNSSMVMAGNSITVTLGTPNLATLVAAAGIMLWTPSAAATDAAGNACSILVVIESGALDAEF